METYEYRVILAPRRPGRVKGARSAPEKFAATMAQIINEEAASGWEYLRADTLPMVEKRGLLSSAVESFQTVLVFRRARDAAPAEAPAPRRRSWRGRGAAAEPAPEPEPRARRAEEEPPLRMGQAERAEPRLRPADEPPGWEDDEPPLRRTGDDEERGEAEPTLRPVEPRPMSQGPERPFGAPRRRDR